MFYRTEKQPNGLWQAMIGDPATAQFHVCGYGPDESSAKADAIEKYRKVSAADNRFIQPADNDKTGHCKNCGRDNSDHEGEPCANDCPQYWENIGIPHPDHLTESNA